MKGLLWVVTPAVVYAAVVMAAFPGSAPRWCVRLARRSSAAVQRLRAVPGRRLRKEPTPPPPDPFAALAVQMRLGVIAMQLQALEADPQVWARGRRFKATQAAYDALLIEACLLAGVEHDAAAPRTEPERFREEMELASRGWSW